MVMAMNVDDAHRLGMCSHHLPSEGRSGNGRAHRRVINIFSVGYALIRQGGKSPGRVDAFRAARDEADTLRSKCVRPMQILVNFPQELRIDCYACRHRNALM